MRQLFVDDDNFFFHEFYILGRQKTHEKVKTSRSTRDFFFVLGIFCASSFISSFFVVFKERKRIRNAKRTRGCLSKRVKNISRRSNTASRAFIHLKLPRVRTAVFGRLFSSGRQRLNYSSCCRGLRKNCRR